MHIRFCGCARPPAAHRAPRLFSVTLLAALAAPSAGAGGLPVAVAPTVPQTSFSIGESHPEKTTACDGHAAGMACDPVLRTAAAPGSEVAPTAPSLDAGATGHPVPNSDSDQVIVDAVIRAYSLERDYWQRPRDFGTWDKLYAHYRQGFSADIAERMTEFTLDNDGDMATWVPGDVHVVRRDDRSALAWFRTPDDFIEGPWGFNPYMVVRLRRESNGDGPRWIVDWATDAATPPAP